MSEPRSPQGAPYIVGIGASAGGLESLEAFFENVERDVRAAYVVVQHLSPDFESCMDDLLARRTDLPIEVVEHGVMMQAGHIYLMPPRTEMIASAGRLLLAEKETPTALSLPIDRFFRSLAQDVGRHAIAIVLSGTGSDGSRGIIEVRGAGGLTIAQSPETAKFNGMPHAAEATGCIDLSVAPESMPSLIRRYINESIDRDQLAEEEHRPVNQTLMDRLFKLLFDEFGVDFSHYKPTTVTRRIHRRSELLAMRSLTAYVDHVGHHAQELNALYKDLLIGVTQFFRDTEAFEELESDVIPEILAKPADTNELRIWTAGCSTGEEAYSLAMLVHEHLSESRQPIDVKIFATDMDPASLAIAGNGVYPAEALAAMSPVRRERYFTPVEDGYRVTAALRKMIVFAQHNLLSDAPFTKLDLIVCRNLLIYFKAATQKKVLTLFHFGLHPNGYLFLGSSETPGDLANEFDVVGQGSRIYRKRRDVRLTPELHNPSPRPQKAGWLSSAQMPTNDYSLMPVYDKLLSRFIPPSLLVDDRNGLVHIFGNATKFLELKAGRTSNQLVDLVSEDLRVSLYSALQQVRSEDKPISYSGIKLELDGSPQHFRLLVEPFHDERQKRDFVLITFESVASEARTTSAPEDDRQLSNDDASRDRLGILESELQFTREKLQATVEELQSSNEEMQATNEELVASNEELQSSNEELHSVNEELYTVNGEHQRKIQELADLTSDLESLIAATDVGVLFLDHNLRVRKFTPIMEKYFNLLPQDVGRPLASFKHNLTAPTLLDDIQQVLRTGESMEFDTKDNTQNSFLLRILPHEVSGRVEGVAISMVDVEPIKRAQQTIIERERTLSLLLTSAAEGIYGIDLNGNCTFCNKSCLEILGYESEEELLNVNLHDVLHHSDRHGNHQPNSQCKIYNAYRQGTPAHVDDEVFWKKDGTWIPVEYWSHPILVNDEPQGAVVSFIDITERMIAQEELRLKGKLIDLSHDAIIVWTKKDGVSFWSDGAAQMYGFTAEEAKGREAHQLLQARHQAPWTEIEEQLNETGEWSGDSHHTAKDGRELTVSTRYQIVRNAEDQEEVLEVNRDITEFLKSQTDLNRTRGDLQVRERAVDEANDGVLITDPSQPDNPIVYANRGFETMTGYKIAEVLGKNCRFLQGEDTDPNEVASLREAIQLGQDHHCRILNYRRDGSPFWNELRISPVRDDQGQITNFIGIQTDATRRVEAENELRRAQQMAADASASKSQFLANMSHEIRTPMTSVIGLTDLLLSQTSDDDTIESLSMIRRSGEHLLGLLNDILDMSKIEAGKLEIQLAKCSPLEIIQDVISVVRHRAEDKGVELRLEFEGRLPATVSTDAMRVRQILINLLSNAIKFTDEGQVTFTTRLIDQAELTEAHRDPLLEFRVEDTGIGISAEKRKTLFDAFVQQDNSSTRRFQGTGLGLFISRELTRNLGGDIEVSSEVGEGSTFCASISTGPLDDVPLISPTEAISNNRQLKPKQDFPKIQGRILIAEDTPGVQFLIRRFLEAAGAEVEIANNGKEAVETYRAESENGSPFSLIVMDMHMPEKSGYDATRELREAGCELPIVALTASAMRGDREKCLDAGCTDYLSKPIDRSKLLKMVDKHLP